MVEQAVLRGHRPDSSSLRGWSRPSMYRNVAFVKTNDYFFHVTFSDIRPGARAARAELADLVDRAVADGACSAAVVLVAVDERTVHAHAAGSLKAWAEPGVPAPDAGVATSLDARFDLASVTKPIVAAALLAELDGRVPEDLRSDAAAALEEAGRRALVREANRRARRLLLRAIELEPSLTRRFYAARAAWRMWELP
ncbi:MAG TPA: serine hydrolase, partial [Agromyces sp.]|nr:serine hydrolase [Agromyces sp.]